MIDRPAYMVKIRKTETKRGVEITLKYFDFLDYHVEDVINGRTDEFMELNQIASVLAVSHKHLTDTIQKEKGNHPCHFYDEKIIEKAKALLTETTLPVAHIAMKLTYDPSNFSKFFKKWTGMTPGNFRNSETK
ncbi:helix-turn-helix domain-containing protein [Sphingobacterium spiritivorum]|uniref:helix-turn-helix domain-containing protein n=1 Tax=Sphingobacterium spiritivorum TaxID=258 RepID=UPI003DA25274